MGILQILGDFLGLIFLLVFAGLIFLFAVPLRGKAGRAQRESTAFTRLKRIVGLAVEAGKRLHISLGSGNLSDIQAGSALIGLTVLERCARAASVSDRPPVATSGDSLLSILGQDVGDRTFRRLGTDQMVDAINSRLTGLTPFAYAAGALPVIYDEKVTANILVGHFGAEAALLAEAGERTGSLTIAGSDSLPGQAVLVATAQEPLIGEDLYAAGAYLGAGHFHGASLRAQDILRWLIILVIILGALAKFGGLL